VRRVRHFGLLVLERASSFTVAARRQTYSIEKYEPVRLLTSTMDSRHGQRKRLSYSAARILSRSVLTVCVTVCVQLLFAAGTLTAPRPQEQEGEIIGTIEGPAIAVKGPMSVQVVGNEVKTLLRSGVDIRVKSGRARIDLTDGGTISVCGPAHISMLKANNALTVALDSGTIHARVDGHIALNIFTAQILAKSVAISDGPQDLLVGFDAPGQMCVRSARGAVHLEEQFGGQTVMVPQGGDVVLPNSQINNMKSNAGLCACDSFEPKTLALNPGLPELSALATSEEVKKSVPTRKAPAPTAQPNTPPTTPINQPKAPVLEPTYQVFMPPLRYDASAQVQDEPDPKLIVLVRRVHIRPSLIFESRVEGDAVVTAKNVSAVHGAVKPQDSAVKPATAASSSVIDRVKTFFKSLWTPSS